MDSRDRDNEEPVDNEELRNEVAGVFVDRMFRASEEGNEPLAARLGELAAAALSGGPDEVLKNYVEGPEYNWPRAVEARRYIETAQNQHNRALTDFRYLFQENAKGTTPTRKLRREFVRICARMERHLQDYTFKYENGSTDSGKRIIVEGHLSRDPVMNNTANLIFLFWNQGRLGVEIGARVKCGVGISDGPRLAQ